MGAKKHFTTKSPKTLFSPIQFARVANICRQTVLEKWHNGEIYASAINPRGAPLFDTGQLKNIKDNRSKGAKLNQTL